MKTLQEPIGRQVADPKDARLLGYIREYGRLALPHLLDDFGPCYVPDAEERLERLLTSGAVVLRDDFYFSVDQIEETELGRFRLAYLEWLGEHDVWRRMPRKQRGVIATAIKKHLHPEDGLLVGPKTMEREYRGKVAESTIRRALRALNAVELIVSIPRKRMNGSSTTSARFPSPAFYGQLGLPVPKLLAEHLGMGIVVPFAVPETTAVGEVAAASGGH